MSGWHLGSLVTEDSSLYRFVLSTKPVGRLHLEDVRRTILEQRRSIAAEVKITERIESFALLRPHEEQCRARTIFPSHDCSSPQRPEIEVRVADIECSGGPCSIGIYSIQSLARCVS